MEKIVQLHRQIAPEMVGVIEERYELLRYIRYAQPIGRRALASIFSASERIVRKQIDFLKDAGLIEYSPMGVSITDSGNTLLNGLSEYIRALHGLSDLEYDLGILGFEKVIVIRGDSEADSAVMRDIGRAAAGLLSEYLGNNMVVAISGGSSMAYVAESVNFQSPATTVVPARGGLGERVEYQANTVAAVLAQKLGGRYRLLHTPDGVAQETLEFILARDAHARETVRMIRQADILLSGIGEAQAMSVRWGLGQETAGYIDNLGAVGETLGHYCTLSGEVVYTTSSAGIHLDDLAGIKKVIAVAGGRRKAMAIMAVAAAVKRGVLITDEAAAREIQAIIKNKNREEL